MPRGGSRKRQVLGALRTTVGNTVGLTTRFSGSYPINVARQQVIVLEMAWVRQ